MCNRWHQGALKWYKDNLAESSEAHGALEVGHTRVLWLFIHPAVCHQINIIKCFPGGNKHLAREGKCTGLQAIIPHGGTSPEISSPKHMKTSIIMNKRVPILLIIIPTPTYPLPVVSPAMMLPKESHLNFISSSTKANMALQNYYFHKILWF